MAKRICDADGKEHDVSYGKTCETGHFICKACASHQCPICKKPLR